MKASRRREWCQSPCEFIKPRASYRAPGRTIVWTKYWVSSRKMDWVLCIFCFQVHHGLPPSHKGRSMSSADPGSRAWIGIERRMRVPQLSLAWTSPLCHSYIHLLNDISAWMCNKHGKFYRVRTTYQSFLLLESCTTHEFLSFIFHI